MRFAASSISVSSRVGEKLNRKAERSSSSGMPIARSTGLGNKLPLEHALPPLARTPGRATTQERLRALGMLPVLVLLCLGFTLLTENFASLQNLSIIGKDGRFRR